MCVFCTKGLFCMFVETQITTDSSTSFFSSCAFSIMSSCVRSAKTKLYTDDLAFNAFNGTIKSHLSPLSFLCLCRISPQRHSYRACHVVRAGGHPQGGHQLRPLQDHLCHLWLREPRHFLLRTCCGALSLSDSQARTGIDHNRMSRIHALF